MLARGVVQPGGCTHFSLSRHLFGCNLHVASEFPKLRRFVSGRFRPIYHLFLASPMAFVPLLLQWYSLVVPVDS